MVRLGWVALAVLASGAAWAGEAPPEFTKPPSVTADGGDVKIEFAVSRATDVAVCVLDAKGRVVRHLAAGVLGKTAPELLKPEALAQSLTWDRKDDLGRPANSEDGPFTLRVSAGLRPTFDGLVGFNPAALGGVRGLATGPDGRLYVFHCYGSTHPNDGTTACAVFDRNGNYLKTILPYPASLPEEKLKGFKRVETADGPRVPFIYQVETRSMVPGLGDLPSQRPVVTGDGRLAFVGVQEGPRPFAQPGEARLTVVGTDGSAPAAVLRALIHPLTDTGASLALSPDGKTVYATGVRAGLHPAGPDSVFVCNNCDHHGDTWQHTVPTRAVYQFGWDDLQAQWVDIREPASGRAKEPKPVELKEPVSVATDKDGNVYVADLADERIVVFKPDGTLLKRIKVDEPQRVEVHRRTGAIYVLSGQKKLELIKLDGLERAKRVARLKLGESRYAPPPTRRPLMALDDSADPPVIWVSRPLERIEDLGSSFGAPAELRAAAPPGRPDSIGAVMELALDRRQDLLYVNNYWRYRPATGQWKALKLPKGVGGMWPQSHPGSGNGAAGLDGNYYMSQGARAGYAYRLDADLQPLPYPSSGGDKEGRGRLRGYARDTGCGLTADQFGNLFAIWKKFPPDPGDQQRAHALYVHGPDGALKKEKLVDAEFPGIYSVRVDYAGNVYLAAALRPGKETLPPGLAGRLPAGPEDRDAVNGVNGYPLIYGSIVKFGPAGGAIRTGIGGTPCNYAHGAPIEVKGAQWIFPGASNVAGWAAPKKTPGTFIVCMCERPGLDVDGFGRSFFCDAGRFRVGVLDTAGNEICWFGAYGNQDSAGPGSAIPAPEIAFAWPQAVAVGDGWAYVGDRLNRRVVRVRLGYAAEAACPLP